MTARNTIDLRERIAICEAFSPEERVLILECLNAHAPDDPVVHIPHNRGKTITTLWAVISSAEHGEGIVAVVMPDLGSTPLVTGNPDLVPALRNRAQAFARNVGQRLKLIKLTAREDVEDIE